MPQHPGSQWIAANASDLPTDLWIAATDDGVLAADESFDRLLELLNREFEDLRSISIVLFTEDPVQ
jgi:hypothetical protein